ncbi:MAG: choice-of-anchor D domain-containing protein, partial [Chloroflexales bacterium]|nr:choice-of-anchor D domain-containing protein [Chloroflexales bacterium]
IASISTPAAPFSRTNCPATLAPNARCTITVTFAPTASGSFSSNFVITTDGGNATVALAGSGISPGSALSATTLDFGSQRVGTSATQSVTLTNNGGDPLTIASITRTGNANFTLGGDCPLTPATLASSTSCTISVTFAPTSVGAKSGSVTITSNAATSPQTISLSGSGSEAGVALTPATFDFGPVQLGSSAGPQVFTLANTGAAPLTISALTLSGDFSQTNSCPVGTGSLAGGASCTISVTFTPGAAGNRSGQLTIFHDATGGSASAVLRGLGVTPAPAVTFSPTSLSFGSVGLGATSAAQSVILTNSGTLALTISSLASTGDFAISGEDCPDSLAVSASCTITLTFTPTVGGQRTGALALASNAPSSPQTVALSGTGLAPRFSSAPGLGALNLSSVIGSSNSIEIVISNTGAAALQISTPTAPLLAPFTVTPASALSIAPGSSQIVTVTCAPNSSGPFSQSLSYTTNDPTQPSATYTITCTGTTQPSASYASAPAPGATLSFGDVAGGQSGLASLSIRETGTAALTVGLKGGAQQTAITGANASSFSIAAASLPLTIADGGPASSLEITCRPRDEGALTATLELTTNDPIQPTVSYTLTCTGVGKPVYFVFMPLATRPPGPADLSVTSLSVTPTTLKAGDPVRVVAVITNNGETAAGAFWADLYIDPTTVPSAANLPWNETCGTKQPCYGLAWLVEGLAPGASITLTSDAGSYVAANSNWDSTLAAGTRDVYLYVDSWNRDAASGEREAAGAVAEGDESNNRAEVRDLTVTPGVALRDLIDPRSLPQRARP